MDRYFNGSGGGSDVHRDAAQRPGKLSFPVPGKAVIDHLLPKVRRQWLRSQHVLERIADGFAAVEGARECLCRLGIKGRARRCGSDEREGCQALRPSRGSKLGYLSSHRMPDKDIPAKAEPGDTGERVVG